MQITLNITKESVKRNVNFVLSLAFIVFATIAGILILQATISDIVVDHQTVQSILLQILFYAIIAVITLVILAINIVLYIRKGNGDYGYNLSAGYAIGVGFSVMIASLIILPVAVIFFCWFFVIPLLVYAINTAIWHIILKNGGKSSEGRTDEMISITDDGNKTSIISAIVACVVCTVSLLVYFICGGVYWNIYLYYPIAIVAPILIISLVISVSALVSRKESQTSWLFLGLCVGLSWVLGSQIGFDGDSIIANGSTNIALSYTAFGIVIVSFFVWAFVKIKGCIGIVKMLLAERSKSEEKLDRDLQGNMQTEQAI